MTQLVLSCFPGIGLLDMAFELEGFCVVRGPDLLWGGDIRRFHPPAGKFDGVIGGPPCQAFSRFRHLNPKAGVHGNLVPEFERVVSEAAPTWFLMENVPAAPFPDVLGYAISNELLNNRWLGEEQNRARRFSFGSRGASLDRVRRFRIEQSALESPRYAHAVTSDTRAVPVKLVRGGIKGSWLTSKGTPKAVHGGKGGTAPFGGGNGRTIAEMCELQGLPADFLSEAPFLSDAKRKAIGNGVPLPMGRAVAQAVKRALGIDPGGPPMTREARA